MSTPRWRSRAETAAGGVTAALSASLLSYWLARQWLALRRAIRARPTGDAIVVFGCSVLDDGPGGELRARLDHATALWRAGCAPLLVVSGGVDRGVDEVQVMRQYLVGSGVPPGAVVDGRPGHNTRATIATMAELGLGRYVAVSSAYHARRIESECARQKVMVVVAAPATTPDTALPRTYAVRFLTDAVGTLWYAVPPRMTDRVNVRWLRHEVPQFLTGQPRPPRASRHREERP